MTQGRSDTSASGTRRFVWPLLHRRALALVAIDLERSFPWPAGTAFEIDGPLFYDGEGRVAERTGSKVALHWQQTIPRADDPGPTIDGKADLTIAIEDKGGGKARVRVTNNEDGQDFADDEQAGIEQNNRRIEVAYRDKAGDAHTIGFQPSGETLIQVAIDGIDHDLNKL